MEVDIIFIFITSATVSWARKGNGLVERIQYISTVVSTFVVFYSIIKKREKINTLLQSKSVKTRVTRQLINQSKIATQISADEDQKYYNT